MEPDIQARFRAAITEEVARTDLEAWMRAHRAELEALLTQGEMDWNQAAGRLGRAGLRVAGRWPDAASARAAWERVLGARRRPAT